MHRNVILSCVIAAAIAGCADDRFHLDANGFPHGTGTNVHRYDSGAVMLREEYVDGRLEHSRWYAPDGRLIQETDWVDEAGEGIYLRDDGTIQTRMTYVDGVAEGPASYYDESGNLIKTVEFRAGRPANESAGGEADSARHRHDPVIAAHPLLPKFVGKWAEDGEVIFEIAQAADETGMISTPADPSFTFVINNARIEASQLRFDTYTYANNPKDADRFYSSGARCEVTLQLTDDPDRLRQHWRMEPAPMDEGSILQRVTDGPPTSTPP